MFPEPHRPFFLKDYAPPPFLIDTVELHLDLGAEATTVSSRLGLRCNPEAKTPAPLVLDGRDLELVSLSLNNRSLKPEEYQKLDDSLTIPAVPDDFSLEIETRIYPGKNTSLEGLYVSNGNFCTQCEPQGFRKITYFIDRPDVMARYTTTITADRTLCPVLLANGNPEQSGLLDGNRHWARWRDPFPKPSYLFAMVAGRLVKAVDYFVTRSGRKITLEVYVEPHNREKCGHALHSLRQAMAWDEEAFGLEYDLDQYMIVAVDDFNMGAMENKGLNIFNSKYVLASPETATDDDYAGITEVIAHEYFHNWTGNRITCRDWFQLSLKEGLTVFRDQEFTGSVTSRAVKRIRDVRLLRDRQFPEDAGPMAHAVQPDSYIEINNFYTITVYEKGAEIIRMIHTLLGPTAFRRGMDLYFARHDGRAVRIDDFILAMSDATAVDLDPFLLWYSQAGTPELKISGVYDQAEGSYTLTVKQTCPPTPKQPEKKPLFIPLAVGLLDQDSGDLPLRLAGDRFQGKETTAILELREPQETFRFTGLNRPPIPSLLRNFSAPVRLDYDYSTSELIFLWSHDSDLFNRWEAGQRLAMRLITDLIKRRRQGGRLQIDPRFTEAARIILNANGRADKAFIAQTLSLPSEEYIGETMEVIDAGIVHEVRQFMRRAMARELRREFLEAYQANEVREPYRYDARLAGRRCLKNLCLSYLMTLDDPAVHDLCEKQFEQADNMTDSLHALKAMVHAGSPHKDAALAVFYEKWRTDDLVMDKWFAIQATAPLADTLERVTALLKHPGFSITNPNKVRALIGSFCGSNPVCFHEENGYDFLAGQILIIDPINPQIAARLAVHLSRWRRYSQGSLMKKQLERIKKNGRLSNNLYEIVAKSLDGV